ncbi:aldo/keto reductase [Actinomadura harenae]|uniref:Aldo/keto reductase n=1 Tax=Actinomadura harenae TaxID=2483351 RepID=A0A3M2M8P0_9ACTN|nr:aldo/keto reductase [Actinomadura harenae]RMI43498.1 aldo/keto reductase [Actinomadura harenae]
MDKRGIGGLSVGAVGLGCMGMTFAYTAGERDDAESVRVIHRAVELGATLIDTSDVYGPFTNEELVGRALRGRRDEVVLATKVGLRIPEGEDNRAMYRDGSPEHIRAAVRESLRRLGTDHIDLYYLHRVDEDVPLEESWGALAELVGQGLVRNLGISDVRPEQVAAAHAIHPVAAVQNELSLWTRDDEVVAWTAENGVGFVPYSPLGRGFLTGTFTSAADLAEDDFRHRLPRFADEALKANLAIVDRVRAVADRHGATPGQVAIAWTLAQGAHVVPIPGTKRVSRLEENCGAADLVLTDADLAELAEVPPPVGTRY